MRSTASPMIRGNGLAYGRFIKARGTYRCAGAAAPACASSIRPGQLHLRSVLFPGELGNRTPWSERLCAPCAEHYGYTTPS